MGEYLAERGHNLVFGSGSTGAMGAAARGFKRGGGKTHGVIPNFFKDELSDYVDYHCDEMTYTETMRERKGVMEDLADGFVIAPGGVGTFEEFFEVLTLKQLGQHRKPIAVFDVDGYYEPLIAAINDAVGKDFIKPTIDVLYKSFDDIEKMTEYLENDDMQGLTVRDSK